MDLPNREESRREQGTRFLSSFHSPAEECHEEPEIVWQGFGTEEDDAFLASVDLYSPTGTFIYNPTSFGSPMGGNSLDYEMMMEDDHLFDTFSYDYSHISSLSSFPSSQPFEEQVSTTNKKTWSDILGHDHVRPPLQSTMPASSLSNGNEDDEEDSGIGQKPSNTVCRYWLHGNCMFGEKCRYAHHHTKQELSHKRAFFDDMASTCCICSEDIMKSGKRFGLMQNCDHLFCLECIRNWRYSNLGDPNVRRCPICRATSFYVIPSNEPIFDPEVKEQIINSYKKNMSTIPCKYFNQGKGICPFGESCFYAHVLENGEKFTARMVMQSDGELRDIGQQRCLGDFMIIQPPKGQVKTNKKKKKARSNIAGDD